MAKAKHESLSSALRRAIRESDQSKYAIAKNSGVDYGVLARFLSAERDIRLQTAEKLAEVLHLRLVQEK